METDWKKKKNVHGLLVMFVSMTDTQIPDPGSPLHRKIVAVKSTRTKRNPTLSRFRNSACLPFCFKLEGKIPTGQAILVIKHSRRRRGRSS